MFQDKAVLVVEDNAFLGIDLSDAIEELDGRVVGPTNQVSQALELLDSEDIAAAILDCHIPGQDIVALASCLAERGVPFVIHVETELPETIGSLHPDVPVLRKPVQPAAVLACLLAEMHKVTG